MCSLVPYRTINTPKPTTRNRLSGVRASGYMVLWFRVLGIEDFRVYKPLKTPKTFNLNTIQKGPQRTADSQGLELQGLWLYGSMVLWFWSLRALGI